MGKYHWKKQLFKRNKGYKTFKSQTHKTFQTQIMISNSKRFSLFRKPNNNIKIVHNCWMLSVDLWQVQKGTLANLTWSLFTITCLYPLTYPHANEFGISTLWMHSCHKYPAWSQDHFVCSLRSNWDRSVLLYLTGVLTLQSKCETLSPVKEDCVAS